MKDKATMGDTELRPVEETAISMVSSQETVDKVFEELTENQVLTLIVTMLIAGYSRRDIAERTNKTYSAVSCSIDKVRDVVLSALDEDTRKELISYTKGTKVIGGKNEKK